MVKDFRRIPTPCFPHYSRLSLAFLQLVTPKSFAGMLRSAADEHDIFLIIGIVNAGTISSFGVLTFIHPVFAVLLADIAISAGAVITVSLRCVLMN